MAVPLIYDIEVTDLYILQSYQIVPNIPWALTNVLTEANDKEWGYFNTEQIKDLQGAGAYAANAVSVGFYLPSLLELQKLYDFDSSYFVNGGLWSSEEESLTSAYYLDANGTVQIALKSDTTIDVSSMRRLSIVVTSTIAELPYQSKNADIIYGGSNSIDEDVYKMLGGKNGTSKNSNILRDE